MRVSTVAICTLAFLASQELSKQAKATAVPTADNESSIDANADENQSDSDRHLTHEKAIAQPEMLGRHDWSRQVFDDSDAESRVTEIEMIKNEPTHSVGDSIIFPESERSSHQLNAIDDTTNDSAGLFLDTGVLDTGVLGTGVVAESVVDAMSIGAAELENSALENTSIAWSHQTLTGQAVALISQGWTGPDGVQNRLGDRPRDINDQQTLRIANSQPGIERSPASLRTEQDVNALDNRLQTIGDPSNFPSIRRGSPALTIANPSGFGVDNNTVFFTSTFQEDTRFSEEADGAIGFGVGLGDARRNVGVELSYTVASFGGSRDFGTGGFNLRVHRRITDNLSASAGWRGILTTGEVDFRDSIYGAVTQIFHTHESLDRPFSRVAVTAGVGSGQFRTESDVIDGDSGVGAFGSVAVRVAQPVSLITEWTGQDLAVGLSIAPFKNRNIVITPAIRDLAGGGDEPRFVLGTGLTF